MKRFLVFVLLVIPVSAFAKSKAKINSESWIEDPYSGYPAEKYLCASESAFTQEDADSRAISAVTGSLTQTVHSEQVATQQMSSEGDRLSTYLLNLKTDSSVHDLSGMEIKNRAAVKNRKEKKYYSRAVLDREKASAQYRITLNTKTEQIEKLLQDAEAKPGTLEQCKCLLNAYTAAAESEYYINMINVLTPSKPAAISYGSKAELESRIRKAFNSVTFSVNAAGFSPEVIQASTAEVINNQGFSTLSKNPAYTVNVTTEFEDMGFDSNNSYYFIRYSVTLRMTENSTRKTLLEFNTKKRVGKLNKKDAQSAAIRGAQASVQEQFNAKLSSLLK